MDNTTSGDQAAQQMAAAAPPQDPTQTATPAAAPAAAAPAPATAAPTAPAPAAAPPQAAGGIAGVMGSVLDMLHTRDQTTVSRDANGNRIVAPGASLTRGQQIAAIALTALKGATTAAAAPPGPGHMGQGVAAATEQAIGDVQGAAHLKDENADHDFAVKQKTKLDNINYQLLTRQNTAAEFELQAKKVKANEDTMGFANKMEDRERELGSYDLGTFKDERELPNVMAKQPQFMQKLYQEQGIIKVPVYGPDGSRQGIHVYERKPDVNAQPAPQGAVAHKFVLGDKPGDKPSMQTFTPSGATNGDIDRYNLKAEADSLAYEKAQSEIAEKAAQAREANASADAKPLETRAKLVEANSTAAKNFAEARKARIEGTIEDPGNGNGNGNGGGGGGGGTVQQNASMMVDGLSSPSMMSKRNKTYDQMLPAANAYSMQKYGVPFDAEVSEGRYQARKKTIEAYASGKEGDQIQSLNQFFGHASSLADEVDKLRNTNSPFINVPLKELRKQMGDARYSQISPLIYAVRKEYQNFLTNNMALHNEDITEGKDMMNDTQSLAQMEGAIKGFGGAVLTRAGQLNARYSRIVQRGDVPGLIDPNTKNAIDKLGLSQAAQRDLGTAYQGPQPAQATPPGPRQPQAQIPQNHPQQAAAAGVPAGAQAGYRNGVLVGYQDAQGWHPIAGGK